jgi:hypothetical protein
MVIMVASIHPFAPVLKEFLVVIVHHYGNAERVAKNVLQALANWDNNTALLSVFLIPPLSGARVLNNAIRHKLGNNVDRNAFFHRVYNRRYNIRPR